jgi:pimeloyl-ACP methyl ester carboxylesterase
VNRRGWQAVGVAGGLAGAAATGAAVSLAARKRHRAADHTGLVTQLSTGADDTGALPAGTPSSVTADDGVRLSCEEIDPAPGGALTTAADLTVVLVHGFALDRRTWHFQRRFLAQLADPAVRQVIYDQRSHGRSERAPRSSCTIEQLGSDLDAVLRAVAPDGPLVLVGHSMGGMTIMALAEQRPDLFAERVLGVALLATSAAQVAGAGLPATFLSGRNPLTRAVGLLAGWQPGLVEGVRRAGDALIWTLTRYFAYGKHRIDPARVDLVHSMISANGVDALTDFVDTLGTHDRTAVLPALAGCEVLVAAGDADQLIPFAHSEVIAAELPEATLVRLPGVGHLPMLEQPEVIDTALADLLARCTGRVVPH